MVNPDPPAPPQLSQHDIVDLPSTTADTINQRGVPLYELRALHLDAEPEIDGDTCDQHRSETTSMSLTTTIKTLHNPSKRSLPPIDGDGCASTSSDDESPFVSHVPPAHASGSAQPRHPPAKRPCLRRTDNERQYLGMREAQPGCCELLEMVYPPPPEEL